MPSALIIGSGPAAAGAALALTAERNQRVTVIDIGGTLEADLQATLNSVASTEEESWSSSEVERISQQPAHTRRGSLPEKRTFGSDFPFRDVGQLRGIEPVGDANPSLVSGAYGGFSNVWGAQVMPFSRATFDRWPVSLTDMETHYGTALGEMTLAANQDDLSELFPLMVCAAPLPPSSDRTVRVLERYEAHRALVRSHGITIGRSRLAFRSDECTRCGLCNTGCPHQLIYSASHTFDRLQSDGRIAYHPHLLATLLEESAGAPTVVARNTETNRLERFSADRIFVACGGIGTTRLVLGSLGHFERPVTLQESVQFVMPGLSIRPALDPRQARNFTLNQFNLIYDHTGEGVDLCQIHFYDYNPAFLSSLPGLLREPKAEPALGGLLRRLTVGLGYVPSWGSPTLKVVAHRAPGGEGQLPTLEVDQERGDGWPPMLQSLMRKLVMVAPALDLWPVLSMVSMSFPAKSYHFGGSFPHSSSRTPCSSDRLGRLAKWDHIHLVDASVFPNVPATTFTLSVMANAHRIATEVLKIPT